jgi:hypothetical protein
MTTEDVVRLVLTAAAAVALLLAAGCTAGGSHAAAGPGGSSAPLPADPRTAAALLKIATAFNDEYQSGDYAPVYARWDDRSQAVIIKGDYVMRNQECHSGQQPPASTEGAAPGPHGAWIVSYEIGGQRLTDYWFYVNRRWVFDLVLSNPDMVPIYRMTPQQYVAAIGCSR